MKILIDAQPLLEPLAGIGRYANALLGAFAKLSPEDEIHLFYGSSMRPRRVRVPSFPNPPFHPKLIRFPGRVYRALTERMKVIPPSSFVGRYDLYHGLNYYVPRVRYPKIVNIYDMSFALFPEHFTADRLRDIGRKASVSAARADKIITGSNAAKGDIVEVLKVPEDRVAVIANGVEEKFRVLDESDREEFRKRHKLPDRFILFVGTVEPRKNIIGLVRAFKKLGPGEMRLVIAGGRGWLSENLFKEIEKLGLSEKVIFTGYLPDDDLPKIYGCASVFAYPSVYEGFGFPPLEAMACGVPVIAGDRSSLPEIVGGAGILVDPESVEALAGAISGVLNDNKLRKNMISKGLNRAREFTWEKCALETFSLYRELAGAES